MDWNKITASYKKNYLPSKKIQLIILVLIIGGISFWVVPYIREYYQGHRVNFSLTGKPPEPIIITEANPTGTDRDTDGDGVPDWQEALFGFDPTNKDTDGDGVIDSLPTVDGKSLGDFIKLESADKLAITIYEKLKDTPTESIDTETFNAVANEAVLDQAITIESSFKKYLPIDINLTDSDKTTILTYQKTIQSIIDTIPDGAIAVKNIQEYLLKGTGSVSLEKSIINQSVTKLLAIPVPGRMSEFHLNLLNAAYYLSQTLNLPRPTEDLQMYTLSIIAQKNINLISKSVSEINVISDLYKTYE